MAKTKWIIDTTHSEVQFKVKHMMISTVTGYFSIFNAEVETEGDDLKTSDFFDAENHPQVKFVSSKLEKVDDERYTLHGDLTIRGTTKPVKLSVDYGGMIQDPWGGTRAGFTVEGKINRKDYGLHWDSVTETGGIVVSDEVRILVNCEFVKQA